MSQVCNEVEANLADVIDGSDSNYADHIASCDHCRDAKHEAKLLAQRVKGAGADYVLAGDMMDKVLARIDVEGSLPTASQASVSSQPETKETSVLAIAASSSASKTQSPPTQAASNSTPPRKIYRRFALTAAAAAVAVAAGTVGIVAMKSKGETKSTKELIIDNADTSKAPLTASVTRVERANTDGAVGISFRLDNNAAWQSLVGTAVPAGAQVRTDGFTRAWLALADGTSIAIDHASTLGLESGNRIQMADGRIVATVALQKHGALTIATPTGDVHVIGTEFLLTATPEATTVRVVHGAVELHGKHTSQVQAVEAGEEGTMSNSAVSVVAAPQLHTEMAWADVEGRGTGNATLSSGIGSLKAYRPGESRDKDWNLELASHNVDVHIAGPVARTEITEIFRNDSDNVLEGVYQFPLPSDARIDSLQLDVAGGFEQGAFVDRERAKKIWQGVIAKAAPKRINQPLEIIWVPGPWRDPALLDWQRGGRFELRIFPIPKHGERTIKISYTQIVAPRGNARQYSYPLPHSTDGSTAAAKFALNVQIRGATALTTRGYNLVTDKATDQDVMTGRFEANAFVPRGDFVLEYQSKDPNAKLRAWTYAGDAAAAPNEALASKKGVGIDPAVVAAQRALAADIRPTAVIALKPDLPRIRERKSRDYIIVVDTSQSMVGMRFDLAKRVTANALALMDGRDRVSVYACDSECASAGDARPVSASSANELNQWLSERQLAGSTDIARAIRTTVNKVATASGRETWIVYIGDGLSSTGFRRPSDLQAIVAEAIRDKSIHVSTLAIGADADDAALAAVARGGAGSFVPWTADSKPRSAALSLLESTSGAALLNPSVELPAGLVDSAPATLDTIRAGQEILIGARMAGDVRGDVVLRGTIDGQAFEQRYPLTVTASTSAGNRFVPALWATLAIADLERDGKGEDRARVVALSQAYSVMSKQTSLLVLESKAMFDAFGVDRSRTNVTWTGEQEADEVTSTPSDDSAKNKSAEREENMDTLRATAMQKSAKRPASGRAMDDDGGGWDRRGMVPMIRQWFRVAQLNPFTGVSPQQEQAIEKLESALRATPDSREAHRTLVQALAGAGYLERAEKIAQSWFERDTQDTEALAAIADLRSRSADNTGALRILSGTLDVSPDSVALHERLAAAYQRIGAMEQSCSHVVALATVATSDAKRGGAAMRCLRSLGKQLDSDLIRKALRTDVLRLAAEKFATVQVPSPALTGDVVLQANWQSAVDLDIALIAADGSRISWMGGRTGVSADGVNSASNESLALQHLRKGRYLIEVTRGSQTGSNSAKQFASGQLAAKVLGQTQTFPFTLDGARTVIGVIDVTMKSRLVPATTW
jgi:ferric-dicitrate binding protein FerR (iron transport regulator)/Mg-chelatase subunit ChlD/tetratricopeptide (TPR) repeat protein